jgi:GntR family transcriptional regulator/MocR family aminotransferase
MTEWTKWEGPLQRYRLYHLSVARRAATFDLALRRKSTDVPLHRWLSDALREEILAGRLKPGARLPSSRDLGSQYGISRGTVVLAYEQLAAEGYAEGATGSGTYVRRTLPDHLLHVGAPTGVGPPRAGTAVRRRLSQSGLRLQPFSVLENRPSRAFRPNLPALDLFPTSLWAQLTSRGMRRASTSLLLGCGPMGYRPLQEAVSSYLNASRGVRCEPGQVAIVSGMSEALDLAGRLFLDPGDRVCMEDPGYPGAARVFEALGARIALAPVDDEGMRPTPANLRDARLVYVTPAHQFPLGATLSAGRRLQLLDWARTSGGLVFEDDYDSEFRYAGHPVPALQGLDPAHVLFAGSFGKVLFPSLRLGYLVVPPDLVDRLTAARSVWTRHPPVLPQAVLCDFMTEGHFARHLRRMRQVYGERLSVLLEESRERLAGLLDVSRVEAGLQTAAWLRPGIGDRQAAEAAARRQVEVTPLTEYTRGRLARQGLQLGFAAVDVGEIRRGVRDLAIALEAMGHTSRRGK